MRQPPASGGGRSFGGVRNRGGFKLTESELAFSLACRPVRFEHGRIGRFDSVSVNPAIGVPFAVHGHRLTEAVRDDSNAARWAVGRRSEGQVAGLSERHPRKIAPEERTA